MAEAVAVAGLIFSIYEVAQRVYNIGKVYVDTVKDGKRTFYSVLIEVSSVKETLECLQHLVETDPDGSRAIANLLGDRGPIEGCRRALEKLEDLLTSRGLGPPPLTARGKSEEHEDSSWRARCRQATRAVTWPSTLETVQRLQREMSQYKTTMTLALQTNMVADLKQVKEGVNELLDSISETQLRDTCGWFERTNPSFRHNEATNKHEPDTSGWIFRTAEWKDWSSRKTRFLWIHGIPGAGKTVLSAFLIKQLRAQYGEEHRTAVTYYYCYFGNAQDETGPFLAWILSQLCRRVGKIPSNILKLRTDGQMPSEGDLRDALQVVLQDLDLVYVVVDAVDESKDREKLMDTLLMLVTEEAFCKIQLLAASREYQDLDDAFRPIAPPLSLAHGEVEKDIRTYIHSQLERRPARTKMWSETLLKDVEDTLATQAKGMFQWAFCQIKRLEKLPYYREAEIRQALATLPKTLFGTYERILLEILEEDKRLARDTMLFMHCFRTDNGYEVHNLPSTTPFAFARPFISLELEPTTRTTAAEQSRVFSESCGCLIKDVGHDLEFTHYTVSEFLESQHLATHSNGRLRYYSLLGDAVHYEYALRLVGTTDKLQRKILSEQSGLPDSACDPAPEHVRDLFWPVVAVGNAVSWLSRKATLMASVPEAGRRKRGWDSLHEQLLVELFTMFQAEQDTIIPRFIPWCAVGEHWWTRYTRVPEFEDMGRFRICHGLLATGRHVKTIINCALLGLDGLMAAALENKDIAGLLEVDVTVDLRGCNGGNYRSYLARDSPDVVRYVPGEQTEFPARTVSGNLISVLDAFNHYLWFEHGYSGLPVRTLIDAITTPNPRLPLSDALVHYLSALQPLYERHHPLQYSCTRSEKELTVARLLDGGADPKATEYAVSPLQLAVEKRNVPAVELLLQHGADPNGVGKMGGKVLKGDGFALRWRSASPLRINHQAPHPLEERYPGMVDPQVMQVDKSAIEDLLEKHGARDFELAADDAQEEEEEEEGVPAKPSIQHMETVMSMRGSLTWPSPNREPR